MWTDIFGNSTVEKVLLYLERYEEGYALSIAKTFQLSVSQVQKQLLRLEISGVLVSQKIGEDSTHVLMQLVLQDSVRESGLKLKITVEAA